jgi:hypothetical protein
LAEDYMPSKYRLILAGGRLIALCKHEKPGVLPRCISFAPLQLLGLGNDLLKKRISGSFKRISGRRGQMSYNKDEV